MLYYLLGQSGGFAVQGKAAAKGILSRAAKGIGVVLVIHIHEAGSAPSGNANKGEMR